MIFAKKEKEIDLNRKYNFPPKISIVNYKGYCLVIAVETGNWIILENEDQLCFFDLLRTNTLQNALHLFKGNINDAQNVIVQLEARDFENTDVMLKSSDPVMHVYLTNSCNLRCPHCYMYSGIKAKNELTTNEILNLLNEYKEYGGVDVVFSGGEICTRDDLYEIIHYSHSIGLSCELLTNGTLWSDSMIERISPFISRIQISIDGYSENVNSLIRGKGNFDKALLTVDKFVKKGIITDVGITPFFDDKLERDYLKYAEFGKFLETKYAKYFFSVKFSGDILDGREVKFNANEREKYRMIIEKINIACYGDILDDSFVFFHKRKGIEENCTYGNLSVSCNGDIFFCAALPTKKPFANIRIDSFQRIMKLSALAKKLSNVNNLKPCKDCELKYICGGDCRINYFDEFVNCDIENLNIFPERKCDDETKHKFYEIMIRTNKRLFV